MCFLILYCLFFTYLNVGMCAFLSLLFRLLFPPEVLFWWAPNLLFPFSGFWVSLFVLSFFLVGVFRPLPCYWRQSYKIEGEMFLNPVGWSWGSRPPASPRAQEEVFQLSTQYSPSIRSKKASGPFEAPSWPLLVHGNTLSRSSVKIIPGYPQTSVSQDLPRACYDSVLAQDSQMIL